MGKRLVDYDAVGNRVRTVRNGEATDYAVNAINQYTTSGDTIFRYDLDGNLTEEIGPDGTRAFTYDALNQLVEVTTPDDTCRTYPHLDSIESNGTTMTIKVLINLMLLRGLLGNRAVNLPFYLDEVASLDHENLSGIVAKSQELGFVPVLASPEAMDAADNLYFLTESKGRVLLEPRTSLLRIHRDRVSAGEEPAAGESYGT